LSLEKETQTGADRDQLPEEELSPTSTPKQVTTSTPPFSSNLIATSKTKPVVLYIVIMFAVALCLIILSFLMQQRNHTALMKGLSTSTFNAQTVVDLTLENKTLEEQLAENKKQLDTITIEKKQLEETNATLEQKAKAIEYLMDLHQTLSSGKHNKAKEILNKMQESGLVEALPSESSLEGSPSPRAIFEEILSALS